VPTAPKDEDARQRFKRDKNLLVLRLAKTAPHAWR
jgi:hypothetical protein